MAHLLPRDERHRASPLSGPDTYRLDPRTTTSSDIELALQHAQRGVVSNNDYLSAKAAISSHYGMGSGPASAPTTPYDISSRHDDRSGFNNPYHGRSNSLDVSEMVRRTNLAVSLANHNINPRSHFTQVHPMMCIDGKFPADFQTPKSLETVKLIDGMTWRSKQIYITIMLRAKSVWLDTQLDRILREYGLPYSARSVLSTVEIRDHRDSISSSRLRQAKLQILFEHLGASRIVEMEKEREKQKRLMM